MSRTLPPHPHLDHLKKQAKELLHTLQQQNPALKLSDAQHALARDYGFASWPKLKVYVESLSRVDTPTTTLEAMPPAEKSVHPFVGRWTANLSKSRRHPSNQFQSATLQFTVAGDSVIIHDVVVDEAGHENHGQNTILADGNEHPSEQGNGYVLKAGWRGAGAQILETVATQHGQVVGWGTYAVSEDGQTLTISGDQQMIVLERS